MKTLKIGFDLDGVILYNPVRIFRSFINLIKKSVFQKKEKNFFIPQTNIQKLIWVILHKTSFKINDGYQNLVKLSKNNKIKLFIITGRYNFLEVDYKKWLKKIQAKKVFVKCYLNKKNMQPYLFKQQMIKKLKLDFYIEDNFDIVEKLNLQKKTKIIWLTNIIDKNISYNLKFFSLKEIVEYLKKTF